MLPSDFGLFNLNFSVLLLLLTLGGVQAVCPYCFGNFASCTYDNDQKCPAVEVPAANALVVAAGAFVLYGKWLGVLLGRAHGRGRWRWRCRLMQAAFKQQAE